MARNFLPALQERPILVAHRGLSLDGAQDNTIAAFAAAFDAGADAIECDLRMTEDRGLVLFHDREVVLGEQTHAVNALDTRRCAALSIPELDDLLSLLETYPGRGAVIDVKTRAAAEELFSRLEPRPNLMVISFSDAVVVRACKLRWNAALIEGFLPMILRDLSPSDAYLSPSLERMSSYIDNLTEAELAISLVGTVDDPAQARLLAARGVWALTTKRADQLTRTLRRAQT